MRHAVYAFCLLFAATGIGHAQAKPNTLTPKEIAGGWILLFDGETTFGWTDTAQRRIKISDNALDLGETIFGEVRTTAIFGDFDLYFEYHLVAGRADLYLDRPQLRGSRLIHLERIGEWTGCPALSGGKLRHLDLNQDKPIETKWPSVNAIGLGRGLKTNGMKVRNIKLRSLNMKPLFNGKDLTGWKEFRGKKSKFTVANKGEIHLKNGPGDLQTVGKYKDFILQLECKSNGKHCNSGIFFRCKGDEYQNGYEAQVLNKFSKDATQKYQVEEFDPKTNKRIGKKEVMSPAFDYGTGGIYRRVPARKAMSKDGEWFAMTIVAHGNHIATWVNGVQVVDWTDNRPKSDNPRNGCRLEAGHISIQGHDATTDLSFRNIRIAELK